jgi:non-heme chloroperoxidase
MMGGANLHYDGIVGISQTDSAADLKKISVPVLVMHGDDEASKTVAEPAQPR